MNTNSKRSYTHTYIVMPTELQSQNQHIHARTLNTHKRHTHTYTHTHTHTRTHTGLTFATALSAYSICTNLPEGLKVVNENSDPLLILAACAWRLFSWTSDKL